MICGIENVDVSIDKIYSELSGTGVKSSVLGDIGEVSTLLNANRKDTYYLARLKLIEEAFEGYEKPAHKELAHNHTELSKDTKSSLKERILGRNKKIKEEYKHMLKSVSLMLHHTETKLLYLKAFGNE